MCIIVCIFKNNVESVLEQTCVERKEAENQGKMGEIEHGGHIARPQAKPDFYTWKEKWVLTQS